MVENNILKSYWSFFFKKIVTTSAISHAQIKSARGFGVWLLLQPIMCNLNICNKRITKFPTFHNISHDAESECVFPNEKEALRGAA